VYTRIPSRTIISFFLSAALSACNLSLNQNATTNTPATTPTATVGSPTPLVTSTTADNTLTGPHIVAISLCSPTGTGGQGYCPDGTFDTLQVVFGPNGVPLNQYDVGGVTDQHVSIFPPGSLQSNSDYFIFLAGGTGLHRTIGVVALSGGSGPNSLGQWTFNFAPGYGYYTGEDINGNDYAGYGQIFQGPIDQGYCPIVADAAHQDQTFDLNYAAAGSVVLDPTGSPGSLLMLYGASNACMGSTGGKKTGEGAYISVGLATSLDYGRTWPTYRGTQKFDFIPLPDASHTQGPQSPFGAMGSSVCMGNDCTTIPPDRYGRYAVLTPPVSLAWLVDSGNSAKDAPHDAEPAAFIDDIGSSSDIYVYEIHNYSPGKLASPQDQLPPKRGHDITMSRARLNSGTDPLQFLKWDGQAYSQPGIGGHEVPILPDGPFENCGDIKQERGQASISYVNKTKQYLLTFVCKSEGDPAGRTPGGAFGSAIFYTTTDDLSHPKWSAPQEITGSWVLDDPGSANSEECGGHSRYPTFMSLDHKPSHLAVNGYVFSMQGCTDEGKNAKRRYVSQVFTITIH
jgi:hypothetical protein